MIKSDKFKPKLPPVELPKDRPFRVGHLTLPCKQEKHVDCHLDVLNGFVRCGCQCHLGNYERRCIGSNDYVGNHQGDLQISTIKDDLPIHLFICSSCLYELGTLHPNGKYTIDHLSTESFEWTRTALIGY